MKLMKSSSKEEEVERGGWKDDEVDGDVTASPNTSSSPMSEGGVGGTREILVAATPEDDGPEGGETSCC